MFSESIRILDGEFCSGELFVSSCDNLQNHLWTVEECPRLHGKSMRLYAWICWQIFRASIPFFFGVYMSYTESMSAYHLEKVNQYIEVNPYFKHWKRVTDAASIVDYVNNGNRVKYIPVGVLTFKRGLHTDDLIADDVLTDPTNELDVGQIDKISTVFSKQVKSIPKKGRGLHVAGTPQDEYDLFYHLARDKEFHFTVRRAIEDEVLKKALWPEKYSYDWLVDRRASLGERDFSAEFQCIPVRSTNGYFKNDQIQKIIDMDLKAVDPMKDRPTENEVRAGFDIGKVCHPSHLAVYEKVNGVFIQILSFWMDEWDYNDQVDYLKQVIKNLRIEKLYYDNTRGEFESIKERGELPSEMKPVTFGSRSKNAFAMSFQKVVTQGIIKLLHDPRQFRQILNCDNSLKSLETKEGHGDSFWSNALAMEAFCEREPRIRWI